MRLSTFSALHRDREQGFWDFFVCDFFLLHKCYLPTYNFSLSDMQLLCSGKIEYTWKSFRQVNCVQDGQNINILKYLGPLAFFRWASYIISQPLAFTVKGHYQKFLDAHMDKPLNKRGTNNIRENILSQTGWFKWIKLTVIWKFICIGMFIVDQFYFCLTASEPKPFQHLLNWAAPPFRSKPGKYWRE